MWMSLRMPYLSNRRSRSCFSVLVLNSLTSNTEDIFLGGFGKLGYLVGDFFLLFFTRWS